MTDSTKLEEIRNQVEGQQVNDVYFLPDGLQSAMFFSLEMKHSV